MKSIRWKLILTSFLLVLLPVYCLNRYAIRSFDRFTSKALEEQMIGHAFMISEQYKTMVLERTGTVRGRHKTMSVSEIPTHVGNGL